RAKVLLNLADRIEKRKDELRKLLVTAFAAESMTLPIQLDAPIEHLRAYADLAHLLEADEMLPIGTTRSAAGTKVVHSMAHRQPAGVCGLIPTWNYPLYVTAQK